MNLDKDLKSGLTNAINKFFCVLFMKLCNFSNIKIDL